MHPKIPCLAASAIILTLAASAVDATTFSLYGAYWDTEDAEETLGGGLSAAWSISPSFDFEIRGAYYQELTNNGIENITRDGEVFLDDGLEAIPIEFGLRYHFNPNGTIDAYIAGGGSYFLLDSDAGDVDDEVGFYAVFGLRFGDDRGPSFFVEGTYRQVEGRVELDPEDLDDIDDLDFASDFDLDLNGIGANAGVRWSW